MAFTDEEKEEIRMLIKCSIADAFKNQGGLLSDEEHVFLRDFIAFWNRSRNAVWEVVVKTVMTFIILAFAAGFVMIVKR